MRVRSGWRAMPRTTEPSTTRMVRVLTQVPGGRPAVVWKRLRKCQAPVPFDSCGRPELILPLVAASTSSDIRRSRIEFHDRDLEKAMVSVESEFGVTSVPNSLPDLKALAAVPPSVKPATTRVFGYRTTPRLRSLPFSRSSNFALDNVSTARSSSCDGIPDRISAAGV